MTSPSKANTTNTDLVKIKGIEYKSVPRPFPIPPVKQKYDYMLKLIIVGDSGVGKTNIISAFCTSDYHFTANHVPTIGVDFSTKIIQLENKRVKLQVWDTAGQERFRTITETYYKGAAGIFLVYSVGNRESFKNVKKWMEQIHQKTGESVKVVLIANKIDLPDEQRDSEGNVVDEKKEDKKTQGDNKENINKDEVIQTSNKNKKEAPNPQSPKRLPFRPVSQTHRVISKKQGWDLASHYNIRYHQVSAKMNQKIDQIFYNMAQTINFQLQQQLNNTILSEDPSHTASYKISHSGNIELSTKGDRRTKFRSKKGIVYHKSDEGGTMEEQHNRTKIKDCKC